MKIVKKSGRKLKKNSDTCSVYEYHFRDRKIDGATAEITGRHPAKGFEANKKSRELCYVIKGKGRLVLKNKSINLAQGDMVLIQPMEKFYWDGKMVLFVACSPKWDAKNHIFVD